MYDGDIAMPDEVILDESGFAVNIALDAQNYPGWYKEELWQPVVQRILERRKAEGIPTPPDEDLS